MAAILLGRTRDVSATARVKEFLRSALVLSEDSTVLVTELRCTEPGCPPLETVLAVLVDGCLQQRKLHKPVSEVTDADVRMVWCGVKSPADDCALHLESTGKKRLEEKK